jgi:hypothetical protein
VYCKALGAQGEARWVSSIQTRDRCINLIPSTLLGQDQMNKPIAVALAVTLALTGCATASKDIAGTYVSPMQYHTYDCQQLAGESQRIQGRVNQLGGRLDEAAANDKALTGIGLILFWPALFALGGTKQQEAEYARLKGEYDAVQQAAILKKCAGGVAAVESTSARSTETAPAQAAPAPGAAKPGAALTCNGGICELKSQ